MKYGPFFRSLGAIGFALSVLVFARNLSFKSVGRHRCAASTAGRRPSTHLDSPRPRPSRGASVRACRPTRSSVRGPFSTATQAAAARRCVPVKGLSRPRLLLPVRPVPVLRATPHPTDVAFPKTRTDRPRALGSSLLDHRVKGVPKKKNKMPRTF